MKPVCNFFCSALILSTLILFSCVTAADYDFSTIDASLSNGDYDTVYQTLETDNSILYSSHDEVIYNLDKGILSHYSGDYSRSNEELSAAEQKIYEYFSKSITQSISSFLINDTVVDYAGELYEDIYTNIFMALNYIHQGKIEDAFVEIRRFDNKLKVSSAQYATLIAQANASNSESGIGTVDSPNVEFHNSALARYLSLILYRSTGKLDSAEIDRKYIKNAFELQPSLYNFPIPSCIDGEFNVPVDQGRLNIIAFTGRSPIKVEDVMRVLSVDASFYYKLALPIMKTQPSAVGCIDVSVFDSTGNIVAFTEMEKIESIEKIAMDTFEQKQALLYLKAIARSVSKSLSTSVFGEIAESENVNSNTSLIFSLLELGSMISNEATERADVRSSRYFPGTAWVTGITLPPGEYDVKIQYKTVSGSVFSQKTYSTTVTTSSLNLMETVCLR